MFWEEDMTNKKELKRNIIANLQKIKVSHKIELYFIVNYAISRGEYMIIFHKYDLYVNNSTIKLRRGII